MDLNRVAFNNVKEIVIAHRTDSVTLGFQMHILWLVMGKRKFRKINKSGFVII